MSTSTYRIPWTYWLDFTSRFPGVGTVVRSNRSSVYVDLDTDGYVEMLSDATHYAESGTDVFGYAFRGVCSSAAATIRSLTATAS